MKSINNINTINALIKDEEMAHKEYLELSKGKNVPVEMRNTLMQMSMDEKRHAFNLIKYKRMRR